MRLCQVLSVVGTGIYAPNLCPNRQFVRSVDHLLEEVHLVREPHDEGHVRRRERGRSQEDLAAHQLKMSTSR